MAGGGVMTDIVKYPSLAIVSFAFRMPKLYGTSPVPRRTFMKEIQQWYFVLCARQRFIELW